MAFVPLHNHSDYSLLDGASQLPSMVERARELGMPAIALTDHGVMYGAIELLKLCKGTDLKPIIGNEMYVINGSIDDPQQKKEKRYHLVVLAKNATGYRNLVKLTSISHLRGMRGRGIFSRACIDKQLLKQHSEGLIIATACLGGEIAQAILRGRPEVARDVARWYQEVFGDDYYLEIQDHGSPEDRIVNVEIVRIAKELGIQLVATNDAHYLSKQDVEAHDALLCVLTGKLISDEKRLRYTGTEYIKTEEEMRRLFVDHLEPEVVEEAIRNTVRVAEKVEDYDILGKYQMPRFPIPEGHTSVTYLREVTEQGLRDRLELASEAPIDPAYADRMAHELKIMEQMGFPTYFLVVWDYIRFAREQSIPVGPGRGSAAGSLVAYALGITNIDPVSNGLLFERFLNPERKSMPDIDTDFCIERRGEVIDYVTERYGEDKVAQIITFNRMTSKAVLKDVARVLDIPYGDADRLAKLIPVVRGKPAKLKAMIGAESPNPEFREKYGDRRTGRAELDNYMTKVYNYFTLPPAKEAFCDAALEMSNESVMVAPADLGSFSARALTRFEGVFEDFFRAFERYETNVATWDRLYGTPAGLYPATRPATQVAENDTVETGNGVRMLDAPIAQPGEGTSGAVNLGSRGGPQDAGTQTAEAPAVEAAPGTADPAIAEEPVIVLPEAVAAEVAVEFELRRRAAAAPSAGLALRPSSQAGGLPSS